MSVHHSQTLTNRLPLISKRLISPPKADKHQSTMGVPNNVRVRMKNLLTTDHSRNSSVKKPKIDADATFHERISPAQTN